MKGIIKGIAIPFVIAILFVGVLLLSNLVNYGTFTF